MSEGVGKGPRYQGMVSKCVFDTQGALGLCLNLLQILKLVFRFCRAT